MHQSQAINHRNCPETIELCSKEAEKRCDLCNRMLPRNQKGGRSLRLKVIELLDLIELYKDVPAVKGDTGIGKRDKTEVTHYFCRESCIQEWLQEPIPKYVLKRTVKGLK